MLTPMAREVFGWQVNAVALWLRRRMFQHLHLQPNEPADDRNQRKAREDACAKSQIKPFQSGVRNPAHKDCRLFKQTFLAPRAQVAIASAL